jgi:hypothetical protein
VVEIATQDDQLPKKISRKQAARDPWILLRGNGCTSNGQSTMRSIPSRRIPTWNPFVHVSRCEKTTLPSRTNIVIRLLANTSSTLPSPITKQQRPTKHYRRADLRYHIYNELSVPSPSTSSRRPRSAGHSAGPEPPRAPTRKLGSKYSLLNPFRKGGDTGLNTPECPYNHLPSASTPLISSSSILVSIPLPISP